MLGLIEKDLRLTLTRKQTLLLFIAMALIMGLSTEASFVVSYLTVLAIIMAVGTISYDEFDNGLAFLMTLPFVRKTYVREKYLFCLIAAALAWCFGTVLYFIGNLIRQNPASIADELPMLLMIIFVLYPSASIMIPLQLKYGSEKSRIVLLLVVAALIFGSKMLFGGSNFLKELSQALGSMSPAAVFIALAAICVLTSFVSYLCSIRIMENKEF